MWAAEIVYKVLANYNYIVTMIALYSPFHLGAEFSKNLYRMPFFAVFGEDELKWKFKPDTNWESFCSPAGHLLVPGP